MAEDVRVRPSTADDAELILAFFQALADYEKLAHEARATLGDIRRDLFGPNPRAFSDIAEIAGAPVGFALWFYNYSTFRGRAGIWLEDLFVKPEARGRGAGKALLAGLARRCASEDLARLEWSVLDWNAPSIAFYRSIGAHPKQGWTLQRLSGEALAALAKQES
ncbi:MAG: GNAT family N-acetyltransferase [Phenylobacterium sp.]